MAPVKRAAPGAKAAGKRPATTLVVHDLTANAAGSEPVAHAGSGPEAPKVPAKAAPVAKSQTDFRKMLLEGKSKKGGGKGKGGKEETGGKKGGK